MNLQHLVPQLKQLRLSGILDSLEVRTQQAIGEQWSYLEFLTRLVQDEVERRGQKQLAMRVRRGGLVSSKTLASFEKAPAIVRILDFLEANGTAYIVMELVRGETVESRLKRVGRLSPATRYRFSPRRSAASAATASLLDVSLPASCSNGSAGPLSSRSTRATMRVPDSRWVSLSISPLECNYLHTENAPRNSLSLAGQATGNIKVPSWDDGRLRF